MSILLPITNVIITTVWCTGRITASWHPLVLRCRYSRLSLHAVTEAQAGVSPPGATIRAERA